MVRVFKCVLGVELQLYRGVKLYFHSSKWLAFMHWHCISSLSKFDRGRPSRVRQVVASGFRRGERKLIRIKLIQELQSWTFTFRIGARQAPEHLRLLISINLYYYLCIAFKCLSLGDAWNPIDACSTSLT